MQNHFEGLHKSENIQIYQILRLFIKKQNQKTDFFTLTSNIFSNHLMGYQKKLIDLSDELFLIISFNKPKKKNQFLFYVYDEFIVNHRI
jgi:hypothetical protein